MVKLYKFLISFGIKGNVDNTLVKTIMTPIINVPPATALNVAVTGTAAVTDAAAAAALRRMTRY